jgi:dCMP deaminase
MRVSWHSYYMQIANVVASRATCDRLHVGCVLVSEDNHVIATGYNGALSGMPHCVDVGCDMDKNGSCIRVNHAENSAVLQAAKHGISTRHATAYCTHSPCISCQKLLAGAGISRVIYEVAYRVDPALCSESIHARTGMRVYSVDEYIKILDAKEFCERESDKMKVAK